MPVAPADRAADPHDHLAHVFDHDDDLVAGVSRFVAESFQVGRAAVVVATGPHRAAIEAHLRTQGVDTVPALARGLYLPLDAAAVLASVTRRGAVSRDLFVDVIGDVVDRASVDGGGPRIYGEMVAVLWERGQVAQALEMEGLWNELASTRAFTLYCGYPMAALAASKDLDALQRVCRHHSELVAPASYTSGDGGALLHGDETTQVSRLFLPVRNAVQASRKFVADALSAWGEHALIGEATIVASELATNALLHASSAFELSVQRSSVAVRITVEDTSVDRPRRVKADATSVGGRGIGLVAAFSSRWGADVHPEGKIVWAELALVPAR